jgi:hypothetical protein
MAGSTSQNLRIRAQELESLLQGLPVAVLKKALEVALGQFDEKARAVVRARLALCKDRSQGIQTILAAVANLPRPVQDDIAAAIMETAAQASLGSDEE